MTTASERLLDRLTAALPDTERQLAWIDQVCRFGVRRPGTAEGARTTTWCADRLREMGYDVELQPVSALTSHPGPASVRAWRVDDPTDAVEATGFTMPFSTQVDGARFRLRDRPDGEARLTDADAALEHVALTPLPLSLIEGAAVGRHDPAGEFAEHVHLLPFGPSLGKEIDAVIRSGAGAMVGVVDAPWLASDYFVPYDGIVRGIPALWLDHDAGARLDRLLAAGDVDVEITTDVRHRDTVDHNVIATAPALCDDWIVIGSHHDAPWASAVEDGSGISQVLAQAAAWSTIEPVDRPVSLAFLLTAAHMSDGAGTREFIASWPHIDRVRFALHLEHIATEAEPDGRGGLRPTDRPEVRWWFTSGPDDRLTAAIVDATTTAVADHDLDRSLVLPAEIFGPMPPTDGGFFHPAGVPMVNLLAAPSYLFDPADTIEMVHAPSLVPTARAALQLTLAAADGWRPTG